ncbi:MAG: prepilin peptidase [Rhodoferax sp.]|uniref:A24 family peptidase n=1 Tax=Rhodoferax sp. TaxID=50421 RepID=UPI00184A4550|nr:prepilin peptidase [Rhodoferax sp.]NMM20020.1 prepilin peptidase [Rhodoferax sp.]
MSLDLTPATWQLWCFAVLSLAMVIAVEADTRERRIPNVLVLLMLCAGVALNVLGPDNGRAGLFSYFPGALGAGGALLGVLAGLVAFLPLYWLRAMGAGDVKLMAALGSFVGPMEVLNLALCILVAGGVLAVLRMLWTGKSRLVLSNVRLALGSLRGSAQRFDPATQSADRMPYALAIASGLLSYGYWRLGGGAPIISF